MAKLSDAIREAIRTSGESLNGIARGSGVSAGQLSRLIHRERELTVAALEKVADYLGLEIVVRPKGRRKGR